MNDMAELRKLVPLHFGPETQGKDLIILRCCCDFEGHGIASEDWEEHWFLDLPEIPYYWKSTTGWRGGKSDGGMTFHGRTADQAIARAVEFMRWFVLYGGEENE